MNRGMTLSEKMTRFLQRIIIVIMIVVLILYLLSILHYSKVGLGRLLLDIPLYASLIGLFYFLFQKLIGKNKWILPVSVFILSLVIYISWASIAPLSLVSDYEVLYNGAKSIMAGDFALKSFDKTNYFYFYNFQIGYTLFLSSVMNIIGSSAFALHTFEMIILSLSNVLLFLFMHKITNEKIGILTSLIYTTFVFNIMGSNVLNNQHLNIFFVLLALVIMVYIPRDSRSVKAIVSLFLVGCCIGIGYIVRQTTIAFILAGIVSAFLIYLGVATRKARLKVLLTCCCLFSGVFLSIKVFDFATVNAGLAPQPTLNGTAQYFKFWLGISGGKGVFDTATTDAEHTQVYYDLETVNFDYDTYNAVTKEKLIEAYTQNFQRTGAVLAEKMVFYMGQVDHQYQFALSGNRLKMELATKHAIPFAQSQYLVITILSLLFFIRCLRKGGFQNNYQLFLTLTFLALFCAYILVEVQTRYRYEQYLLLAIFAGIEALTLGQKNLKSHKGKIFLEKWRKI